jgi:predicted phosphoribosyltransferase
LARALEAFSGEPSLLLALVPGGVGLGIELSRRLALPLEPLITSKLCLPGGEEGTTTIGAMAERGDFFLDLVAVRERQIHESALDHCTDAALHQIERRIRLYRAGEPLSDLYARTLILVSEGFDSLSTARVALATARRMMPRRLLLAVPALSDEFHRALSPLTSAIYTLQSPGELERGEPIGRFITSFDSMNDEEAAGFLRQFRLESQHAGRSGADASQHQPPHEELGEV